MNQLLDIITRLKGRIEGGSEYGWDCFGPNSRYIDFPNVGVIFDGESQEVYSVDAWPNNYDESQPSYFWVNKDYEVAHRKETVKRNIPIEAEQVYSFPAIMSIAEAVMEENEFDPELANEIELFFEEGELEMVMRAAELEGMTIDEFVNAALKEKLDTVKSTKKKQNRTR
jgi:hypothetical protein